MRVAGLDIGSSVVKACLFDLEPEVPQVLEERTVPCALLFPGEGWAEHDLVGLEAALQQVLEVVPQGCPVGWASAMHALVPIDRTGQAICNAISWADGRSGPQAVTLQSLDPLAHARTGTPVHPMAWPAKLLWIREQRPEWWSQIARITDLKSYLWERATGEQAPLDRSSASGTGLWNNRTEGWDEALCAILQLDGVALPAVVSGHRLTRGGRDFHLGGADGPYGNLGVGAVGEGRTAVSLGTSGAVRRHTLQRREVSSELFLYALDTYGWMEGGAISNAGSVLQWLQAQQPFAIEEILEQASRSQPGAYGLQVYPYFAGERAPFWRAGVRSQISGWSHHHVFGDVARATLEGVAFSMQRLLHVLGPSDEPLRCTGGLFESAFWCRLLANVTGSKIAVSPQAQATALGAALGTLGDALERSRALPLGQVTAPDGQIHAAYQELFALWREGDFASLRSSL